MKKLRGTFLLLLFSGQIFSQIPVSAGWWGKSVGKFTQLAYSEGYDRLGSAKMGYIDTGILLNVVDSTAALYEVRLSKNHTAFVQKADILRDSSLHPLASPLSSNWKVKGGKDKFDTLFVRLDEKIPYKSWMEINPSRILIDLYGVRSNTNWITQFTSLKEIKNTYFTQVEDDVEQLTIELRHHQHWGYTIAYHGDILEVLVKRQPPVLQLQKLKIAIDAGHGGTNIGAQGVTTHIAEKEYTLLYAKALEKYLRANGVRNIVLTRRDDTTFGNTDRVVWLQKQQPDLLVSLHFNSSDDSEVRGSSSYYKDIGFRQLSVSLLKEMLAAGMQEYGNVGNFNFLLNQPTDFPSALLEIAFLSNQADEKKILSSKFRNQVARQVYLGLVDFLNKAK